MRDTIKALCGACSAVIFVSACTADAAPSMSLVVQTFTNNQSAFNASLGAIGSIESPENRLEIRRGDAAAQDSRIGELFNLQPVSVEKIIVYSNNDLIDYMLYGSGLSVGGKSWSIRYGGGFAVSNDPAIAAFPSCEGVDLKTEVEGAPTILSAGCSLGDQWVLEYTAN